jgi:hypothetical protein
VVRGDLGGGLDLDRELHVVDDEIDLDATGQTPVAECGERLRVRVVSAEFVEDPVLEGLAVQFGAAVQLAPPGQVIPDLLTYPPGRFVRFSGFGNS